VTDKKVGSSLRGQRDSIESELERGVEKNLRKKEERRMECLQRPAVRRDLPKNPKKKRKRKAGVD